MNRILLLSFCSLFAFSLFAQTEEPTTVTKQASGFAGYEKFRFGGYGEMGASYLDYGFNRFTPTGSVKDNRGQISIPRFILAFDYKFSPTWILGAEIEFEYGGTGVAREIEFYEEGGEYEMEVEKGGEVALEQFHITKLIHPSFNVRAGHLIVPPAPFRSNLDATSEIEAAMEACADLAEIFMEVKTALDLH